MMTQSEDLMLNETESLKPQIEFLFKIIGRYDAYITSTNSKASLIIAWNGVVLGFVLLKYDGILGLFPQEGSAIVIAVALLSLVGLSSIVSIALVFRAISPFTRGKREEVADGKTQDSIVFFGTVASMKPSEYAVVLNTRSDSATVNDLAEQACLLANGLKQKMLETRHSVLAIYVSLLCLSGLLLLKAFAK